MRTFSNSQDKINNQFGQCLRGLRLKADLNLRGFAQKVNSSAAWLSYLERGRRIPSWELIEDCAKVLKDCKISQKNLRDLRRLARRTILEKTFSGNGKNGQKK